MNQMYRRQKPLITSAAQIAKLEWAGCFMSDEILFDAACEFAALKYDQGDFAEARAALTFTAKHGMGIVDVMSDEELHRWREEHTAFLEEKSTWPQVFGRPGKMSIVRGNTHNKTS